MRKREEKWYWHAWHNLLVSLLRYADGGGMERRRMIRQKPADEVPLRLRLFQRATLPPTVRQRLFSATGGEINTDKDVLRLHKQQCPRCPWGVPRKAYRGDDPPGVPSIFTRRKKNGEWW